MNDLDLIHFRDDYIISWDVSDKDNPCITVSALHTNGTRLVLDVLGHAYEQSGVISLRQILEAYNEHQRVKEAKNNVEC